ncbi:hypothetical protein [Ligilactobacillus salivarius]
MHFRLVKLSVFFYVDCDDEGNGSLERLKKDLFYWHKKVIESNGTDLD